MDVQPWKLEVLKWALLETGWDLHFANAAESKLIFLSSPSCLIGGKCRLPLPVKSHSVT